jgi:hypothetical protein
MRREEFCSEADDHRRFSSTTNHASHAITPTDAHGQLRSPCQHIQLTREDDQ